MTEERMKIDLHMHTVVSDGTDTPAQILEKVKAAGIGLFSVTDHDAIKAAQEVRTLLRAGDPRFLTGAEFSCKDEEGKYHILGYGFDPGAAAIRRVVDEGHGLRMKKVAARLDFLKTRFGFAFPEEEISALMALDNPGKPHIANLMVKYGYADTKEQAIGQFIDELRFRSEYVRPEDAIRGIRESGGAAVLAHPSYGDGDELILGGDMDRRIRRLTEFGLEGLEIFYSGFTERLRRELLDFAGRYDLYITAGSDYHGTNKIVELGDTGVDPLPLETPGLRRFLEEMERRGAYAV